MLSAARDLALILIYACDGTSAGAAVREEEAKFKSSAKEGCNLLPLKRCIFSDHLTPVLAYRCLVKEDDREAPSFLFESVEQGPQGTTNVVRICRSLITILLWGRKLTYRFLSKSVTLQD